MSDIFISYASEDRSRAAMLVSALGEQQLTVWWDRTIPPDKTWDDVIEEAIEQAKCVIVLWTEHSVGSHWVRIEAEDARQRGILVPALLQEAKIPLAFRRIQAARLIGWSGELDHPEFLMLCRAVRDVIGHSSGVRESESARAAIAESSTQFSQPLDAQVRDISAEEEDDAARRAEQERLEQEKAEAAKRAKRERLGHHLLGRR